jgi:type II secretory pathway component GspD/PulD (secretin)
VDLAFGLVGKMAEKYGALDLTLQALQRNGTAEVLSKPSIIATQGQPAAVRTAQKTPVLNIRDATTSGIDPANLVETITVIGSYVETKIELAVLPKFIGEGFVTLDLRPTVSGVTGFSTGPGGTSAPIISSREANTVVTLADGETLIVGGLYTTSTVSDKAKVPLLAEIPVVGKLFERTKDQKVKTELVFFVTPHILRKRSDFKVIVPPGEAERLGEPCAPGATPAGAGPAR